MGNSQGSNQRSASVASEGSVISTGSGRSKHAREHKRHGVVTLKMVNASTPVRRGSESVITNVITPKGCIIYGSSVFNPAVIQNAIVHSGYPVLPPTVLPLQDTRAHKVLVSYCKGWHVVPFPEQFSRHSGTCLILGDRTITSPPFQVKVGDCFRLGSVGLVVSELRVDGQPEQRIDAKTLEFLKDEALAFDTGGEMATLAADEERMSMSQHYADVLHEQLGYVGTVEEEDEEGGGGGGKKIHGGSSSSVGGMSMDGSINTHLMPVEDNAEARNTATGEKTLTSPTAGGDAATTICGECRTPPPTAGGGGGGDGEAGGLSPIGYGGITPGERFVCYMCYENHDTEDDALVAPCECKGDTRYLHVQCLQKWYQASITGVQTQVIRTTGNGAPACKICGTAYKTAFRKPDGRRASLLETESNGPYLSLVVVTKHDTNPDLFNTKFRLNFNSRGPDFTPDNANDDNVITIGRSSSCNMILDYRTVSTVHARIAYEDGKFYLSDRRSSNGTMVYLQDPLPLPYSHCAKLRMGRTTISLQARRNWTSVMRSMVFGSAASGHSASDNQSPDPLDIQNILADCMTDPEANKEMHSAGPEMNDQQTLDGHGSGVGGENGVLLRGSTIRTIHLEEGEGEITGDDQEQEQQVPGVIVNGDPSDSSPHNYASSSSMQAASSGMDMMMLMPEQEGGLMFRHNESEGGGLPPQERRQHPNDLASSEAVMHSASPQYTTSSSSINYQQEQQQTTAGAPVMSPQNGQQCSSVSVSTSVPVRAPVQVSVSAGAPGVVVSGGGGGMDELTSNYDDLQLQADVALAIQLSLQDAQNQQSLRQGGMDAVQQQQQQQQQEGGSGVPTHSRDGKMPADSATAASGQHSTGGGVGVDDEPTMTRVHSDVHNYNESSSPAATSGGGSIVIHDVSRGQTHTPDKNLRANSNIAGLSDVSVPGNIDFDSPDNKDLQDEMMYGGALPTAGIFTTFGQQVHRKTSQNHLSSNSSNGAGGSSVSMAVLSPASSSPTLSAPAAPSMPHNNNDNDNIYADTAAIGGGGGGGGGGIQASDPIAVSARPMLLPGSTVSMMDPAELQIEDEEVEQQQQYIQPNNK